MVSIKPCLIENICAIINCKICRFLYQITTKFGTRDDGTFILGDKCSFDVTAQLPEEPAISWPLPLNVNDTIQTVVSDDAQEAAQEAATR